MSVETLLGIAAAIAAVVAFGRGNSQSANSTDLPPLDYAPINSTIDIPTIEILGATSNLSAFLYAIRRSEHRQADVDSGDCYGIAFGGFRFTDYSDHPTATGEWMGRPLDAAMCRAAGQRVGCKSTAAGAYQITRPTWDEVRSLGAWGPRIEDFSPASQDEAARRILMKLGALPLIDGGDIAGAASLAASRWASLPGAGVGQPMRSAAEFVAFFNQGLTQG